MEGSSSSAYHFTSYLEDIKIIFEECIYDIVRARDSSIEILFLQSVPIMNEFPKVFPDDLLKVLLDRDINFGIDILLFSTHLYSTI